MPKAILEFLLPDDQDEFDAACAGDASRAALRDFDEHLRSLIKYGSIPEDMELESLRETLRASSPPGTFDE